MRQRWLALETRVSAMSARERVFIFVAALVAALALVQVLVVDPLLARTRTATARILAAETVMHDLAAQQRAMQGTRGLDPDASAKAALAEHSARLAGLNAEIAGRERSLIPPAQMTAVLRDVVGDGASVTVVGIKTLAPEPVALDGAAEGAPPGFYRHGFEVTAKGRYAALVAYLTRLEALPWRLNWTGVTLDTSERPELTLTLTVHTLSLDEAWLRI